ncbi:DUF1684 domain-containing protein [Flavobacterium sp.]|uniref:DUF1684 domain-containing protein n=1 Tax=Flavobacterium sp. TaxID=239 RepID=UPI00260A3D4F|nr:DUF1684 domain-containing protein [Flavobacterium sp.]
MKKLFTFLLISCFLISNAQDKTAQTAIEFQDNLNLDYADKEKSPLTDEDLKNFKALDFFPISDNYIVEATFVRTKKEKAFKMKTSTNRLPLYKKYGELYFTIDGVACKLNVYQNIDLIKKPGFNDYLFLPFSDLTSGKESYIGGRYVDLRIQEGKLWKIDFNKAYNPYCAYNHKYSCPIVPLENDLNVEILAGVKKFHD